MGDLVEGLEVVGEDGFVDILRPRAPDAGSFSFVVDMVREECCCNVVRRPTVEDGRLEVTAGRYRDSYIWRRDDIKSWLCADMYGIQNIKVVSTRPNGYSFWFETRGYLTVRCGSTIVE